MFVNEGYQYAGLILACLSLVLMPIPFVLARYGLRLRQKSPWAREMMAHGEPEPKPSDEETIQNEEVIGH